MKGRDCIIMTISQSDGSHESIKRRKTTVDRQRTYSKKSPHLPYIFDYLCRNRYRKYVKVTDRVLSDY